MSLANSRSIVSERLSMFLSPRIVLASTMLGVSLAASAQPFIPIDHKGESPSAAEYVPNEGQLTTLQGIVADKVLYYSHHLSPQMFLLKENKVAIMLGIRDTALATPDTIYRVDMALTGANVDMFCEPEMHEIQEPYYNYFLGHCPQGITHVKGAKRIIYPDVYPGIDFHVYSNAFGPKLYFVVHPGADPDDIELKFTGQDSLGLDLLEQLKVYKEEHSVTLPKGIAYQQNGATTEAVDAAVDYEWTEGTSVAGFAIGGYDPQQYLIIDVSASMGGGGGGNPDLPVWCTYYGHTESDYASDAALLGDGSLVVCGSTQSQSFPTFFAQDGIFNGSRDAYYSVFDPSYKRLYTTFFGGNQVDNGNSMTLSPDQQSVYLYGESNSTDLSLTEYPGGFNDETYNAGNCYIARFSLNELTLGEPEWVTHFGSKISRCNCIRSDSEGNVYISGHTDFSAPPTSESTCAGTDGTFPICGAISASAYVQSNVAGDGDAIFARFNDDLQLVHSTFFGGSGHEQGRDLAVDNTNDRVYLAGNTLSRRLAYTNCQPPTSGSFPLCDQVGSYFQDDLNGTNTGNINDAYLACFGANGALTWSTFIGSTADDIGKAVHVNPITHTVYLGGFTTATAYSANTCLPPVGSGFPRCASGTQTEFSNGGGSFNEYILKFNTADHTLAWSTFFGGAGNDDVYDFHWDEGGNTWVAADSDAGSDGTPVLSMMPRTGFYYQPVHGDVLAPDPAYDGVIMAFNPDDEQIYGSYFGGLGTDACVKVLPWAGGRIYTVGSARSVMNFPFNCPPLQDPYCYMDYTTVSPKASEAFYAQLLHGADIGVEEEGMGMMVGGVVLFPNPSEGLISLEWNEVLVASGPPFVSVYDVMGRVLVEQVTASNVAGRIFQYDISRAGRGMRFVRVRSADGEFDMVRPIVIQ